MVVVVGRVVGTVTLGYADTSSLTWTTTILSLLLTLFSTISVWLPSDMCCSETGMEGKSTSPPKFP